MSSLQHIEQRLRKIASDIEFHSSEVDRLEEEAEELEEAKAILLKHFGNEQLAASPLDVVLAPMSKQQRLLYLAVPIGKEHAKKPADVVKSCPKLDAAYVRTTLWRFSESGTISSENGQYWREMVT